MIRFINNTTTRATLLNAELVYSWLGVQYIDVLPFGDLDNKSETVLSL